MHVCNLLYKILFLLTHSHTHTHTHTHTNTHRAVLCRDGGVVFETKDHNPDVPEEEERITAAGGHVHTTPSKQKIITDKGVI